MKTHKVPRRARFLRICCQLLLAGLLLPQIAAGSQTKTIRLRNETITTESRTNSAGMAQPKALAVQAPAAGLFLIQFDGSPTPAWQAELRTRYIPGVVTITLAGTASDLPQALDKPASGQTAAWLCQGTRCLPPINDIDELMGRLG